MEPREAVERLLYEYAERIDAGDFAGVAELFTHGMVTSEGSSRVARGPAEVLDLYTSSTRRYPDGTPRTRHLTTNVIVDVHEGGSLASARSYFTVLQAVAGELALQPVIAGRYRDDFELADGGWRFARRHIVVDLVGDLHAHLLFGADRLPGGTNAPPPEGGTRAR